MCYKQLIVRAIEVWIMLDPLYQKFKPLVCILMLVLIEELDFSMGFLRSRTSIYEVHKILGFTWPLIS